MQYSVGRRYDKHNFASITLLQQIHVQYIVQIVRDKVILQDTHRQQYM